MKKRWHRSLALLSLAIALPALAGCELFLGSGETPNVSLDLGQMFATGRSLTPPAGISFTRIEITVYGPGMTTITKTVSPGSRYLNMYVPAGAERRFRVEAFFDVVDQLAYPYTHLRSYIGRTTADLSAGRVARLAFTMVAGSTEYLVPDELNGVIDFSNDLSSFNSDSVTVLGAGTGIGSADVDISAHGVIYSANYAAGANVINFASNISGLGSGTIPVSDRVLALAMDRNAGFDVNRDKIVDSSVLYFSTAGNQLYFTIVDSTPTAPQPLNLEGRITAISGLAVDQWTHKLYLTGTCDGAPSIVVYDPLYATTNVDGAYVFGRILTVKTDPSFRSPFDVNVTDTAVYVLNANATTDVVPSIMEFDRDLSFLRGYGSVSRDATGLVPSTAPGAFYFPLRFVAKENDGLTILDDSNVMDPTGLSDYDKLVHIDRNLDPFSWTTFPQVQQPGGPTGENFRFFL